MTIKILVFLLLAYMAYEDLKRRNVLAVIAIITSLLALIDYPFASAPIAAVLIAAGTWLWLHLIGKVGIADRVVIPFVSGLMGWASLPILATSLISAAFWCKKRTDEPPLLTLYFVAAVLYEGGLGLLRFS